MIAYLATPRQHVGPVHQFLEHSMHMSPGMATAAISTVFVLLLIAGIGAGLKKVFS